MKGLLGLVSIAIGLVFLSNYYRLKEYFEEEKKTEKKCPECENCTVWIVISILFFLYVIYKLFRYFTKDTVLMSPAKPIPTV